MIFSSSSPFSLFSLGSHSQSVSHAFSLSTANKADFSH